MWGSNHRHGIPQRMPLLLGYHLNPPCKYNLIEIKQIHSFPQSECTTDTCVCVCVCVFIYLLRKKKPSTIIDYIDKP